MIDVTILMSTSPIPSNPSTRIIDAAVASIHEALPDAPLIIMCDGMPASIDSPIRMMNYGGFKETITGRYVNSQIIEFDQHVNQAGMLERALQLVKTPLVFYVEHDWVIRPHVEWEKLSTIILSGRANQIKLHAGARICPYHQGMMLDYVIWDDDVSLIKTNQWSQNPHIASTEFYQEIHAKYLRGRKDAIENIMHGICSGHPWEDFKLMIYNPTYGDMHRVYHIDGREGER